MKPKSSSTNPPVIGTIKNKGINDTVYILHLHGIVTGKGKGDMTTNHCPTNWHTQNILQSSLFKNNFKKRCLLRRKQNSENVSEVPIEYIYKERWPQKNAGEVSLEKKQSPNTLQVFSIRSPKASHDFGTNPFTQIQIIWTKCFHLKALSPLKSYTAFYKGKCSLMRQAPSLQ